MPPSKIELSKRIAMAEKAIVYRWFADLFRHIALEPDEHASVIIEAVRSAIDATAPTADVAGIRARLKLNTLPGALAYVLTAVRAVSPDVAGRMVSGAVTGNVPSERRWPA